MDMDTAGPITMMLVLSLTMLTTLGALVVAAIQDGREEARHRAR